MWYNTIGTHEEPYVENYLCSAMSRGGVKWDKPDLGLAEFADSTKNNIFMKWSSCTYCVVKDKNDPDPIRRYKLPYWPIYKRDYCGIWAAFSADAFDRDGFQYSLKIEWIWDENALSEEELSDDLDQATIWRVLDVDHANRFLEDLTPNIGKRAELHLYLADDEKLYETFLLLLAPYNSDRAARSLAKSTPRWWMVGSSKHDFAAQRSLRPSVEVSPHAEPIGSRLQTTPRLGLVRCQQAGRQGRRRCSRRG